MDGQENYREVLFLQNGIWLIRTMMMKLTQAIRIPLALFLLVGTGCQQSLEERQQKIVPMNVQLEQLASVVAGTKYLKYKCNRSDLPTDDAILAIAKRVAKQRGWNTVADEALLQRSDLLYQSLIRDSTSEQTKCSSFNSRLVPFINELRD
jgi:general secretion pathway protein S